MANKNQLQPIVIAVMGVTGMRSINVSKRFKLTEVAY